MIANTICPIKCISCPSNKPASSAARLLLGLVESASVTFINGLSECMHAMYMFGLLYVFAAAVLLFRMQSVHVYQVPEDELQLQQVGTSQISTPAMKSCKIDVACLFTHSGLPSGAGCHISSHTT